RSSLVAIREVEIRRRGNLFVHVRGRCSMSDRNEGFGIGIRQRLQNHAIENGEDGAVGADADRERRGDGSSDRRRSAQRARAKAHASPGGLDEWNAALVAARFLGLNETAEIAF